MDNTNNSYSGEYFALYRFIEKCNNKEPCILEFSGSGIHAENIYGALLQSGMMINVVWLDAPIELCKVRGKLRKSAVPAPYEWGDIEDSVESIYSNIEHKWEYLRNYFEEFKFYRIIIPASDKPDTIAEKIISRLS